MNKVQVVSIPIDAGCSGDIRVRKFHKKRLCAKADHLLNRSLQWTFAAVIAAVCMWFELVTFWLVLPAISLLSGLACYEFGRFVELTRVIKRQNTRRRKDYVLP